MIVSHYYRFPLEAKSTAWRPAIIWKGESEPDCSFGVLFAEEIEVGDALCIVALAASLSAEERGVGVVMGENIGTLVNAIGGEVGMGVGCPAESVRSVGSTLVDGGGGVGSVDCNPGSR